ncbi:sensor histidine kinase [Blautia schinkii]|nr:sensor histidine kinase [Blautia schinkii]
MKTGIYLEERAGALLLQAFFLIVLEVFLAMMGMPVGALFSILAVWLGVVFIYCGIDYRAQKRRYTELEETFDSLEEKYVFTEVIKTPSDAMGKLYFECSRAANHAMLNRIDEISAASREYKEYIESWIHEVKNPISAIELYCTNHPTQETQTLQKEIKRIDALVNQALYYARSGAVEHDYFISCFSLVDALLPVMQEYRSVILQKGIRLEVDNLEAVVYTDSKWVGYIFGQVLSNAVKYVENKKGKITIQAVKQAGMISLLVKDNGCGISKADMLRIYEKGFTGKDRKKRDATGMGLYLTRRLCEKLGLLLNIESDEGVGTTVTIGFPITDFHQLDA